MPVLEASQDRAVVEAVMPLARASGWCESPPREWRPPLTRGHADARAAMGCGRGRPTTSAGRVGSDIPELLTSQLALDEPESPTRAPRTRC